MRSGAGVFSFKIQDGRMNYLGQVPTFELLRVATKGTVLDYISFMILTLSISYQTVLLLERKFARVTGVLVCYRKLLNGLLCHM
jgi:hypothetical protein